MSAIRYVPFAGRLLIGLPFAMSGLSKLAAIGPTTEMIRAAGLPLPPLALAISVAIELGGGPQREGRCAGRPLTTSPLFGGKTGSASLERLGVSLDITELSENSYGFTYATSSQERNYDERRSANLFQGLGLGPTTRVFTWLAAVLG
jgi:DoxX